MKFLLSINLNLQLMFILNQFEVLFRNLTNYLRFNISHIDANEFKIIDKMIFLTKKYFLISKVI